jgi:hypothetical protein
VKSRDGLSMAKRGLSNSEDQTKSAKKKKAEDAEVDAAPGSRVYTVEYQVDTTIDEFDEDFMNGDWEDAMLEEDYEEAIESVNQREIDEHNVHESSKHLDVVYGSMASAKAAAKDTVIRLCKEYWKLQAKTDKEEDEVDDDDMDRYASTYFNEYKEGNWTRLYKYLGSWNLKFKFDKKEPDVPEHMMSTTVCVGIRELKFVE